MSPETTPHSKPYEDYLENIKSVVYLLKTEPPVKEQITLLPKRKLANVIYCSCVLLFSSYLEKYIESIVVEMIDLVNKANLPVNRIPEQLRNSQIKDLLNELEEALEKEKSKTNIEAALIKTKDISERFNWFLNDTQLFHDLSGEPLIGDNRFSNPSPEKIDALFRVFGINSLVGHAIALENKPDRGALRDKVKEMIDKRNDIAHTGGTVVLTREDVISYWVYSRRLVRGIDRILGNETQRITGSTIIWR
jgi:hypothetical protein